MKGLEKDTDVSVIIVNYNTKELTKKSINSIYEFTKNQTFEIIVVDNASVDGSKEFFSQDSRIKYIYNEENLGFGKANNLAIDKAKGKYVFLLNSDAYLIEDSIDAFWNFMEDKKGQRVACCGANVINENGDNSIIGGNLPSVLEAIARVGFAVFFLSYYKKHLASGIKHLSGKGSIYEIEYVTGADMFIRKDILSETKAFDSDFFLYYEESEMSFRFKQNGYKSYILAHQNIVHIQGGSSNKSKINKKIERIFSESRYLYFEKCYNKSSARFVTFLFGLQSVLLGVLKLKKENFIKAKIIFETMR